MAACTTGQGLTALTVIHKTPQHIWKKQSDPSLFPIQRPFGTTEYAFTLVGQVMVLARFSVSDSSQHQLLQEKHSMVSCAITCPRENMLYYSVR